MGEPTTAKARSAKKDPRRRASADTVVAALTALIREKVYRPGDRLREQELAERFGVSRGPVREALRILEAKALVRIEPMRGASVMSLSDAEALEAVEISAVLFGLGVRKAVGKARPEAIESMRRRLSALESMCAPDASPREFYKETVRIGLELFEVAAGPRLTRVIEDVRLGAPDFFGPLGFTSEELRRTATAKWGRMVDAVESGDAETAEALAREVYDDSLNAAIKVLS